MNTEWTPPADLTDAKGRMRQLQAEIEEIDAQLRSTKKKKSMEHEAWKEWRERTIWAKVHRVQDLRHTKDWIYENGDS